MMCEMVCCCRYTHIAKAAPSRWSGPLSRFAIKKTMHGGRVYPFECIWGLCSEYRIVIGSIVTGQRPDPGGVVHKKWPGEHGNSAVCSFRIQSTISPFGAPIDSVALIEAGSS
jgi:hypothetical protein